MMKRTLIACGLALLMAGATAAGADVSGEKILAAIDAQRNFANSDFSALATMIQEDPEEGVEKKTVQSFRRDREDKFVFLFLEPAVQKGQGYLMIDDNLWFYDPESRQFSHSSMKEQLGGTDARNSDFGSSDLTGDYSVVSISEGTLGQYQVYILEMEAKHNEVTYPRQTVWVTRDRYLVLKTQDYSETGRLLRTSLYPNYAKVGDQYIASRMIFVDELVKGKKTSITLSQISLARLPDSTFTKTYIERVNR